MDKLNFITNGMVRLPPGFRFQPTDEELLFQYLRRKVFSCTLPASIIPHFNISNFDPWDLPGNVHKEKYFFSKKEAKYRNGNRSKRTTNSGYWKTVGSDKKIKCSKWNINDDMVGLKKTLVFYRGKSPHGTRTYWVMHEYCLVISREIKTCSDIHVQQIISVSQNENWVLCRIFMKKRNHENIDDGTIQNYNYNDNKAQNVGLVNFMTMGSKVHTGPVSSSSSSSSSSGSITEVSSSEAFQEANSPTCNLH